jgi:hypothetical protein
MSKTLAESAAEILKASMSAAGKEPAATMSPEVEDLGGSTNDNPAGLSTGAASSAKMKMAAKPGAPGVPAEGTKKMAAEETEESEEDVLSEEDEIELTEEEIDEYLDSLTEEELEALANEEVELDEANHSYEPKMHRNGEHQDPDTHPANGEPDAVVDIEDGQKALVFHNYDYKKGVGHGKHTYVRKTDGDDDYVYHNHPKVPAEKVKQDFTNLDEEVDSAAERAAYKAGIVVKYRGSMKEDVDALFNGESLSEDFRVKATLIFEAAVQSRVEAILEEILDENDAVLEEAIANVQEELSEQVDDYLNYVVEEWVEENQVAIETGLRAELVEDFIGGLKNLFAEHYIDIPDTKVDIAEALAAQVAELQEEAEETEEVLASLVEELSSVKKTEAIARICEGLTQVQAEKMKSLAEGVEFTAEGDFDNKLAVIRENYFPSKVSVKSEVKTLQETSVEEPEVAEVPSYMRHYVNAISKTAPSA